MKWGLSQGILGGARATLAPSSLALGPNTYLDQQDFLRMMGLALVVHVLAFGIAALVPRDTVTDIPVRALSFKLGGQDKIAAYNPSPAPVMVAAAPVAAPAPAAAPAPQPTPAPVMKAVEKDSWRPTPSKPSPVVPAPLKPAPAPKPQPQPVAKYTPATKAPRVVKIDDALARQEAPAVAPTPQQYVREVGAPTPQVVAAVVAKTAPAGVADGAIGGQGSVTSVTAQTAQAVRAKYEQEISGWIQQHKFYPAAASGREGRVLVRMRIDRAGNVRYYAIEQSSGLTALDDAALDMIRRANPVPAVPVNYPAGNLVEFLIPISFKAPT